LGSGQKFNLVGQRTTGAGPKYTETPWSLPLIAVHNWVKPDIFRVLRAYGREILLSIATSTNAWYFNQSEYADPTVTCCKAPVWETWKTLVGL
jgi:hypothetical protein